MGGAHLTRRFQGKAVGESQSDCAVSVVFSNFFSLKYSICQGVPYFGVEGPEPHRSSWGPRHCLREKEFHLQTTALAHAVVSCLSGIVPFCVQILDLLSQLPQLCKPVISGKSFYLSISSICTSCWFCFSDSTWDSHHLLYIHTASPSYVINTSLSTVMKGIFRCN